MQLGHDTWKPVARSPDMNYHTGWYSYRLFAITNKKESLWREKWRRKMIVVSDNFDFVIDDQYFTISILLKYKPRKHYPFYAGLKIRETFDSVSTKIPQCQHWIVWNLFKRFLKCLYFFLSYFFTLKCVPFLFSLFCGVNSQSTKRCFVFCGL